MNAGRLAVNGHSDSESVGRAIRGMELLVEMGRAAERALAEIKATGWTVGEFPVLDGDAESGAYSGTYARLERRAEIVRQEHPSFDDLRVALGGWLLWHRRLYLK